MANNKIIILVLTIFSFQILNSLQHNNVEFVQNSSVYNLTENNFNNFTQQNNQDRWFIMFYAPWCPHCKKMIPTWIELAVNLTGEVKFGVVDCDAHSNLRDRFAIAAYPTLLYFAQGKYYEYNAKTRDPQVLNSFATKDYLEQQGEEIPLEASFWRTFTKSFGIITIVIISLIFVIIAICCIFEYINKEEDNSHEEGEVDNKNNNNNQDIFKKKKFD